MLLHDARREARFRDGELVLLADQDRALLGRRRRSPRGARRSTARSPCAAAGPYVVQAAIASLHADEPRDWPQIAALYGELARLTGSPVVELNRAVAVAEARGPRGRARRSSTRLALDDYRYLHSTRGELLRRLGRTDEARDAYAPRARSSSTTTRSGGCSSGGSAELGAAPGVTPAAPRSSGR